MSEESILQQNTIELFRRCGWLVHHNYNSIHSEPGFLDMVAVKAPQVCFAEFKGSKGKLTKAKLNKHGRLMPGQEDWFESLQKCPSVLSFVWRPNDWEQIVKIATKPIDLS
jgi:hypothetical protein